MVECGGRDERGTSDVGLEHAAPCFGISVDEPRERTNARRVYECIDAAETVGRLRDGGRTRLGIDDVTFDRERAGTGFGGCIVEPLPPPREERDVRAPLCETGSDAASEAA